MTDYIYIYICIYIYIFFFHIYRIKYRSDKAYLDLTDRILYSKDMVVLLLGYPLYSDIAQHWQDVPIEIANPANLDDRLSITNLKNFKCKLT